MDGVASSSESYSLFSESKINLAGITAYQYEYFSVIKDTNFDNCLVIFSYNNGIITFQMSTVAKSQNNYSDEFYSILNSIKIP